MHRTYGYKDFIIDVETESTDGSRNGTVLSVPGGYVAVVRISSAASPAPVEKLRVARDEGSPFGTETEALMRGYGVAQRIVDEMIALAKPGPKR
ncbi:hypothetical protein OKW43_008239 [Paraburkholderia sp. WC7.3g]|uniref:Uncharacterized protein n=1 Tax=Paraburkholderia podalyriae TaxID=1938811 RepID=A0ABR7Q0S3_9BURK|nr:hypothetical protein [Paraburkholderia podalyriae]MBC8752014.1 hypothetical protein [Paraburkholderia podalyriae]